jgi:MraZ protein
MVTYFGSTEHGLDDKGRITLPARILDRIAKQEWKFYLCAGLDRCVLMYDQAGWDELLGKIGTGAPSSRAHRNLLRRFLGHAEEVVPDATRRIRIPDPLLTYAGLQPGQAAVLLGTGRILEIWAQAQLGSTLADASPEEESLFATLVGSNMPSTPPRA